MAYQSLYRRYRPQTFGQIRGQRHMVAALQNAVVKGEVGHAYLLHGPRGTGKTSSARVLAKALNCENLGTDGEPCGTCESCVAIEHGRSFDLHELDAAGNNRVEDMRALLGNVNLGTPGRAKVYVLDEVHMLTSQAENALLKTLEEPPQHVTWVLATTEPHKVVETIRSRCQVFELTLLGADEMAEHVRWVSDDAGLDIGPDVVDHVVAAGGGSVRDTLSALDRVVAAGGMAEIDTSTDTLLDAIAGHDVAAALAAVGDATGRGRDPRTIGERVLAGLREAFLTALGSPPPRLTPAGRTRADRVAAAMNPAAMTRALETLGVALVEMRQAPDPRVDLEVALVRLCRPAWDRSVDALAERIEQLERRVSAGVPTTTGPERSGPRPAAPAGPGASGSGPRPAAPAGTRGRESSGSRSRPAGSGGPESARSRPAAPGGGRALDKGAALPGPAAARRTLADKRAEAARAPAPNRPGPEAAPPPPVMSPARAKPGSGTDLRALRPQTAGEVVELASRHFGMDRDVVVSRAMELLGPRSGQRSPDDLARLWTALVDDHGSPAPARSAHGAGEVAPEDAGIDAAMDHENSGAASAPEHADGDGPAPSGAGGDGGAAILEPAGDPRGLGGDAAISESVGGDAAAPLDTGSADAQTAEQQLLAAISFTFPGAVLKTNKEPQP